MVENKPGAVRRPRVNQAVSQYQNIERLKALVQAHGGEVRRAGDERLEQHLTEWMVDNMAGPPRTSKIVYSALRWDKSRGPDRVFDLEYEGRFVVGVKLRSDVKIETRIVKEYADHQAHLAAAAQPTQPTQPPLTPAIPALAPAPASASASASATATPAPASASESRLDTLWNRVVGQYQRIAASEKILKRIEPMVDGHEARLVAVEQQVAELAELVALSGELGKTLIEGAELQRAELEDLVNRVEAALAEQRQVEEGLRDEVAELRATVAKQNEALEGAVALKADVERLNADVERLNAALVAVLAGTGTNGNGHVTETWKDKALRLIR